MAAWQSELSVPMLGVSQKVSQKVSYEILTLVSCKYISHANGILSVAESLFLFTTDGFVAFQGVAIPLLVRDVRSTSYYYCLC